MMVLCFGPGQIIRAHNAEDGRYEFLDKGDDDDGENKRKKNLYSWRGVPCSRMQSNAALSTHELCQAVLDEGCPSSRLMPTPR